MRKSRTLKLFVKSLRSVFFCAQDVTEKSTTASTPAISPQTKMNTSMITPSDFGLRLQEKMREAATAEVRKHLAEGRSVYGYRDGKLVEIKPNRS